MLARCTMVSSLLAPMLVELTLPSLRQLPEAAPFVWDSLEIARDREFAFVPSLTAVDRLSS